MFLETFRRLIFSKGNIYLQKFSLASEISFLTDSINLKTLFEKFGVVRAFFVGRCSSWESNFRFLDLVTAPTSLNEQKCMQLRIYLQRSSA
jgi:purine-nucleoside phosphorylase